MFTYSVAPYSQYHTFQGQQTEHILELYCAERLYTA